MNILKIIYLFILTISLLSCTNYYKAPDKLSNPGVITLEKTCSRDLHKIDKCQAIAHYSFWIDKIDSVPVDKEKNSEVYTAPGRRKITIGARLIGSMAPYDSPITSIKTPYGSAYNITLYDSSNEVEARYPANLFEVEVNVQQSKIYKIYPSINDVQTDKITILYDPSTGYSYRELKVPPPIKFEVTAR